MFTIDVLGLNREMFAEFYEKDRGLISSVSAAIMTAHPPQLEFCLFVDYAFYKFMRNYCLCRIC